MVAGIARLALVVSDLHDVSAPIETASREATSVAAIIGAAREALEDLGATNRFDLELSDDAPEVPGDPAALTRAFTHVMRIAAAGAGTEPVDVTVRALHDGDHVRIEVSDNGEPLPRGVAATLFDPFGQPRGRGMIVGAGVSGVVAARVIAAHRGTITADEALPHGLTMTIRLPVAA